jgi:SAM-dependent methyltransferase
MSDANKVAVRTGNFEFEALTVADNYRRALLAEFSSFISSGDVIEIGAGIGQFSKVLAACATIRTLTSVEPDAEFCAEFRRRLPRATLVEGTVSDLPSGTAADAIVSVNVLEHIEEDQSELSRYAQLLRPRKGVLCLFVPARQEIYAPLDKEFGHFRRYSKANLSEKLQRAGFQIVRLHYFNFAGYFAWWLIFCLLRRRSFKPASVRRFDQFVLPVVHFLESRIIRPPLGQSIIAIARASTSA